MSRPWKVSESGRQRGRIENEGFNTQNNHGYNMEHKFSRRDINVKENHHELMQIAHMVNQLTEKLTVVKKNMGQVGITLAALTEDMVACMRMQTILYEETANTVRNYIQLEY